MKTPIGILGGTFDPIHFGHLRTALELQIALDLKEVRLMPCAEPVHRNLPFASPGDRLAMTRCAVRDEPALIADETEILRGGPSFTIDTLERLREDLPDTPLCLLMGMDVLASLHTWERYTDMLSLAHFVIAWRPPHRSPETCPAWHILKTHQVEKPDKLHTALAGQVLIHSVTPLDISATDIRQQVAAGKNPRYLLPDAVCDYIRQHHVYQNFSGETA